MRLMRLFVATMLGLLLVALPAQGARQSESKAMTIRLVSVTTKTKVLKDVAPLKTTSKGDVFWAKSTLRNEVPQFGKAALTIVGSDVSTFAVVSAVKGDVKVTVSLPGGTLRAAGRVGSETPQRIRVLGGTGVFSGARGVAESRPLGPSGNRAENVYKLQLP